MNVLDGTPALARGHELGDLSGVEADATLFAGPAGAEGSFSHE